VNRCVGYVILRGFARETGEGGEGGEGGGEGGGELHSSNPFDVYETDLPAGQGGLVPCRGELSDARGWVDAAKQHATTAVAPTVLISKLAVAPLLRRRGIGRALLSAAVCHAREGRAAACCLHVDEANAAARALYLAFGFRVSERVEDMYSPGRHGLVMTLRL